MDEADLEKRETVTDNEDEYTVRTEYWYEGALVHASAHVRLKKAPKLFAEAAELG
jgi:hypothetical protein